MKKLTSICLILLLSLGVMAQNNDIVVVGYGFTNDNGEVQILAKDQCCIATLQNIKTDKSKGQNRTWAVWDDMEMAYMTDTCTVKAPVAKDFDRVFPNRDTLPPQYVPLYWMLSEENGETVLHCYFTMPVDEITNLWLACDETAIVDMATGVQYRARRTSPDCFRKHFTVKAPAGTPLDFKIYFPKLPSTTKEIAIYGVPMWYLRGTRVKIFSPHGAPGTFQPDHDNAPNIKPPTLVNRPKKYNKDKHTTWAVYNNPHLIKPVEEGTMALWNTPEATYIAIAHEQNWMREYYRYNINTMLIDNRGHQYKLKSLQGLPIGELFWIEAYSGDYIAFLLEFDPLPPSVTTFTYIEPASEQFYMWGADWEGEVKGDLNVNELIRNQHLFEPIQRVIKK